MQILAHYLYCLIHILKSKQAYSNIKTKLWVY